MLSSFVFKDSQQQHYLLRNMIIERHVRSDLSLPDARANQLLFQDFALYFTFLPAISIQEQEQQDNYPTRFEKQYIACN